MILKNKIVLVTGGAGFIGSHLVDKCLEEGAEKVIVFDNFISGSLKNIIHLIENPRIEICCGDVGDFNVIKPLVQKSDYVFHEAASKLVVSLKNPRIDLNTNIIGTFNILEAARDCDNRIINASTGSVFGSSDEPMSEKHPHNPSTLYGISKSAAERYALFYAKEFGIKVSVLRYFHVYGPRQDFGGEAGVISIFLGRILHGEAPIIFGSGEQIRCFTYISDDVDATLFLAKKNDTIGEDYNVASDVRISVKELADLLLAKYSKNKKLKPIYHPPRQGENMRPIPDTKKIEILGFEPKVSFEEGLDKTKEWVQNALDK